MLELGLKFTAAYWLGSLMGGLVVGRLRPGVDLRGSGSGNVGATNALRTQGAAFAAAVMLIDVGKGVLAVAWLPGLELPGLASEGLDAALVQYACGVGAVAGHVWPLWFGFRGGKGGATAAGVLCWLAPALGLWIVGLWLAIIFLTGFVGLATMTAAVGAALVVAVTRLPEQHGFFVFAALVAALIVYTHRGNIMRMIEGTESRTARFFGFGRR